MFIDVEAAGCPETCRHCAVDGHQPYGELFSLDELRALKDEWGPLTIRYEPTTHPDFPEIYHADIATEHGGWLVTNGFGLARREDYGRVFEKMRGMGIHTIALTLHGLREHHDWFVCRSGAYEDILLATRRATERGFIVNWQIFVDQKGIKDIPVLVEIAFKEVGDVQFLGIPYHRVGGRLWHYEKIRLTVKDIESYSLHKLIVDPDKNLFLTYETLAAQAWLEKWKQSPDSADFKHPFEPRSWPPTATYELLSLRIDRNQKVCLDPLCSPPVFLGKVSDGQETIMERLEYLRMPVYADLQPGEVKISPDEQTQLHPTGFSFRYKEISKKRLAKYKSR
ncbi:MAG TPA: radical SAM protein [Anaerolineales bacterium]|nr:radical SAM protein [Anaerolineales bacterium]